MLLVCLATAFSVTTSSAAIAALERPSAIRASTSRSRGGEPLHGLLARHHGGHHLGVEHGAPAGHPAQGVDELADVADPVLEQVADPALAVGQELAGVDPLDVLRQDEHREARPAPAYVDRGPQALVGAGRRQPDVEQRPTSAVDGSASALGQRLGVLDGRDDLEVVRLEQPDQAVPEEGLVLGEDDAHGTSSVTRVGPPVGLDTLIVPSKAASRRATPLIPVPATRIGTAAAVVADDDPQAVGRRGDSSTQAWAASACLPTLARHSATAK